MHQDSLIHGAVSANVDIHGITVTLPIVHDQDMSAHTPRAHKRRTEAGMDTPPARRRTTPSPARTAPVYEHLAGKFAQAELEFRARADVADRDHDAAMRKKSEEVRLANSVHDFLNSEVKEFRGYAAQEHAAAVEHRRIALHARDEYAAACTKLVDERTHADERVQHTAGQAVDKAKAEAERLHALLLRIAESDAQTQHKQL